LANEDKASEDLSMERGDNPIPRIRLGEIGSTGLSVRSGNIYDETRKELRHPYWCKEVKKMLNDAVIGAAIETYKMWLARSEVEVIPYSDSVEDIKRANFIKECIEDLDHPFEDFLQDAYTHIEYGFAPIEMVFKQRLKEKGSIFNDGLTGWKKLPLRNQETIYDWKYSDNGRELIGLRQDLNNTMVGDRYNSLLRNHTDGLIYIPIEKLMLFGYNKSRGSAESNSSLKKVWSAWRNRVELELAESVGSQRSLAGIPVYYLAAEYMSPDAPDDQKAAYAEVCRQMRNFSNNEQSAFVIPNVYDQHSKQRLFSLETLEVKGNSHYDTDSIIKRWDLKILTTLLADVLTLGQGGGGSFALSENKTALLQMSLEARHKEIAKVIRHTLIKTTFQLNGWDSNKLPDIKFTYPADVEIDNFGKLAQRLGSIEFMPRDGKVVAWVMKQAGYPDWERFEDMESEQLEKLFPSYESGAGEALGSGKTQQGGANSANNADNAP
jgi:hypothetical protein